MWKTHPEGVSCRKKGLLDWIDKDKIKRTLKCPRVEKMGVRKEIFVFDELK